MYKDNIHQYTDILKDNGITVHERYGDTYRVRYTNDEGVTRDEMTSSKALHQMIDRLQRLSPQG